jgi:hypothetical protein
MLNLNYWHQNMLDRSMFINLYVPGTKHSLPKVRRQYSAQQQRAHIDPVIKREQSLLASLSVNIPEEHLDHTAFEPVKSYSQ